MILEYEFSRSRSVPVKYRLNHNVRTSHQAPEPGATVSFTSFSSITSSARPQHRPQLRRGVRRTRTGALAETVLRMFTDDDRVINDDTNRHNHAKQAYPIDGLTTRPHDGDSCQ